MKRYWIRHEGNDAILELRELPIPEPGPGQVLLRVRAASLNRDVMPAITDGRIAPVIDRVFPFDQLPLAKTYVESGAQIGKVVVRLDISRALWSRGGLTSR
jgi:NADPH:quinone reductase-like Zn-dependent oxidoreductase